MELKRRFDYINSNSNNNINSNINSNSNTNSLIKINNYKLHESYINKMNCDGGNYEKVPNQGNNFK